MHDATSQHPTSSEAGPDAATPLTLPLKDAMQRARIERRQRRQAALLAQREAVREANARARAIHAMVWEEKRRAEQDLRVLSRAVTPRVVRPRASPVPKGARRHAPPLPSRADAWRTPRRSHA